MTPKTIIVIMTPIVFILLFSVSLTSGQQHDDDYVDPTDLFNFDPAHVRMIPSKKSNTVSVDTNGFPKDSQDKCEQTGTCGVPHPRESDSDAESQEFTARKQKNDAANDAEYSKVKHSLEASIALSQKNDAANDAEYSKMHSLEASIALYQKNDAAKDAEYSKIKHSLEASIALSRQYVNKLLYLLEPKVGTASSPVEINLRMKVSYHDIVKLRKFGDGNSNEIHDVYEILNYMMQFASESLQPESSIYWLEVKTGLSSEVLWHILAIVTCVLLILTVLSQMTVTWRMLKQLLFVIVTVSVIFNWIELYQKHKADQEKILMMEKLSDRCPKMDDLSFFSKITTYFTSIFTFQEENCREYFQAMLVSPLVKATPIEALSVAIVKTVVTPLGIVGNGIKAFFVGLLKDLPGQYQMFMIVILLVLIVLLLFFSSGYYLRIFGLISLGPSESRHSIQGPPHTNQHHIENRGYPQVLGAPQLQLRTPHDQGMLLVEHQRSNNVPPLAQGYDNTAVAGTGTHHMDVSSPIEHGNRLRLTRNITDRVNQTDCEGTPAVPVLNMITATGASQNEVKKTDKRQQYKQEGGDGSRQEVATVVSSVAHEGNLTDGRQQCKHDSGDCSSLENAKAIRSAAYAILQEGNLSDSKETIKQESGDDGGKCLVVTSLSSPVANASLTKQDKNPDVEPGKDTEHVARESTNLPCTDNTSQTCDTEMVMTEGIESMNILRNS